MTGRERLLKVLNRKATDRVPIVPFIHNNFVNEFFGTSELDVVEKTIEVYDYFNFDIIHRTCNVWEYLSERLCDSRNWKVNEKTEYSDNGKDWKITTSIKTPEKELTQVKRYSRVTKFEVVEAIVEYFIKEKDDFTQFYKYQPHVPKYDCSPIISCRDMLGDKGLVAPWGQGAFNSVSFYRKLDDLILDPYTDFNFYHTMIEYFAKRMLDTIMQFVHAGADVICCGGNVANSTMTGPVHFENYVLPYEIEFAKKVKALGVYYLYHNCGDAKTLLNYYSQINMDIYESLTTQPYGDTILEEAFEKINRDIVLMGNIDQIEFLKKATKEQVREKVRSVMALARKRGNFILATSDYLSEDTPYDNLRAFAEAGMEFGRY